MECSTIFIFYFLRESLPEVLSLKVFNYLKEVSRSRSLAKPAVAGTSKVSVGLAVQQNNLFQLNCSLLIQIKFPNQRRDNGGRKDQPTQIPFNYYLRLLDIASSLLNCLTLRTISSLTWLAPSSPQLRYTCVFVLVSSC